eukprot:CAMPEP_0170553758 /NCGR_PEP_ID=MMETSP0211-20121228/11583_1 /TAXON_ID=311385 /ORGANISM="Pseudokeronopsis sp., Strain OXSARD2" /LENGTH=142 /DNA_ID=CAMNT_0010862301 /DNA_START=125 /DNA_END=554 /DNA_ORIENTATION=+
MAKKRSISVKNITQTSALSFLLFLLLRGLVGFHFGGGRCSRQVDHEEGGYQGEEGADPHEQYDHLWGGGEGLMILESHHPQYAVHIKEDKEQLERKEGVEGSEDGPLFFLAVAGVGGDRHVVGEEEEHELGEAQNDEPEVNP